MNNRNVFIELINQCILIFKWILDRSEEYIAWERFFARKRGIMNIFMQKSLYKYEKDIKINNISGD